MSVLTQEQIDALNNFARTYPHLAKVFGYTSSDANEGLGDALNDGAEQVSFNPDQFYLTQDSSGNTVVNITNVGGGGLASITFKDGTHTFSDDTLSFNGDDFYLTQDSLGNPEVNLVSEVISDHGDLSGLLDDDHSQYILVDGTRDFTGNQSLGGNRVINLGAPVLPTDAARLQDIGPGFYGIIVKDRDHIFVDDTLTFNGNDFYLTQDSMANPVVNLSKSDPRPSTSRALLTKTVTTTITDGAATSLISWESVVEDMGGWFNPVSPTRLTVPSGIKHVRVTCKVSVTSGTAPGATSSVAVNVLKNGAIPNLVPNEVHRVPGLTSVTTTVPVATRVLTVSPGDFFELTIRIINWGANPTMVTAASYFAIEAVE